MSHRIVVIGGVAAGPSAAAKAKRINPEADVTLIEKGEHLSYGICEVPYYVAGIIHDIDQLTPLDPASFERTRGVKVKANHFVENISAAKKRISVRDMDRDRTYELPYDKLILATGSKARGLHMSGENARNVFQSRSLNDGIAFRKFLLECKPRHVLILGGGYIGVEYAEALVAQGVKAVILDEDLLPMRDLEEEARIAVLQELKRNGVDYRPGQVAADIRCGTDGIARAVRTQNEVIAADGVIVCAGVEPNAELASSAGIRLGEHGGILTDQRQSTSVDSVFAAGDCCEVKNIVNNKWMYLPLATYASRQGRVAGENAAGGRGVFKGVIRAMSVKVFDLEVAHVGLSSKEAVASSFDVLTMHTTAGSKVKAFPGNQEIHIIATADKVSKRLVGANIYGGQGAVLRANVLAMAIQHKLTVDDISQSDLAYSPPFSPLWDPVLVMASQLKSKLMK